MRDFDLERAIVPVGEPIRGRTWAIAAAILGAFVLGVFA